ncbi:MAG: hypothetical protein Q9170_003330 [Blastenia crenularia]
MLDPLTAIALAGNVVQFVQFGCTLVANTHEIYKSPSGALEQDLETEAVTNRILESIEELDDGREKASYGKKTSSERRLVEIAEACTEIAKDIVQRLEKLKLRESNSVWASISKALKAVWSREELNTLTKRLKAYISELETTILISIKQSINLGFFRASADFDRLGRAAQRIVDLLLLNRSVFVSELHSHTSEIKDYIAEEQAQTRSLIQELARQKGISQATSASYFHPKSAEIATATCHDDVEQEIWKSLLDSLAFPAMRNREEEIIPAYHTTLKWIFNEPSVKLEPRPWTNFIQWLRHGRGIYWINGKAGSGKSTLMKYIFNDKKSPEALSEWAGSLPLMVANFFFWNSGTHEQRSQMGLLRSLLFQILQYQPTLASSIFPEECAKISSNPEMKKCRFVHGEWTLSRLQRALRRFIQIPHHSVKVCFFIDGLDEFEGNDEQNDPLYLVDLLRSLSASPFIKICTSSRPLLMFETAFRTDPGLRLQDLTTGDIRRYVYHKLAKDDRMQHLAAEKPIRCDHLINEISEKAQGVFLWVKLVVRSLLDGLGNHDRIQDMEVRLRVLPVDLQQLYYHMLMRVEPMYLQKASEVFQLVRAAQQTQDLYRKDGQRTTPVTVLQLVLAINDTSEQTISDGFWSAGRVTSYCDEMRSRLQTWCAGLLEVPDFIWNRVDPTDPTATLRTKVTWEVAYLHRTARDFLESEAIWTALQQHTANTGFEPYSGILQSTVQLYEVVGPLVPTPLGHGLFRKELLEPLLHALMYAQRATSITGDAQYETLERLDKIAGEHVTRWTGHYFGHWAQFVGGEETAEFLDLAVFFDLHSYIEARIRQEHRHFLSKAEQGLVKEDSDWAKGYFRRYKNRGNPDIDAAQQPSFKVLVKHYKKKQESLQEIRKIHPVTLLDTALQEPYPDPRMIKILLDYGADPNEISGSNRLWEHVLRRTDASVKRGDEGKAWLHVIRLFILHGVDPRGYNIWRWPSKQSRDSSEHNTDRKPLKQDRDTAKLLLLRILDSFDVGLAAEVDSLKKLIDRDIPWSKRYRMKMWRAENRGRGS